MKHLKPFNESNYEREKRTFSKEQANSILYDEGIYDDNGDTLYSVVESNVTYTDQEKNRVEYSIVIKEESTGKFFSGCLADSPWWKQAEANAEEVWERVIPYTVTVTKYRAPNKSDILDMNIDKVIGDKE